MRPSIAALAALAFLLALAPARPTAGNALTADIAWKSWSDMQSFDYASNDKPIMYFFHKSWCGACKRLVASLNDPSDNKNFVDFAKEFVMVNILDDDAGTDIPVRPVKIHPFARTKISSVVSSCHWGNILPRGQGIARAYMGKGAGSGAAARGWCIMAGFPPDPFPIKPLHHPLPPAPTSTLAGASPARTATAQLLVHRAQCVLATMMG